jgi:hypothetical protein
MVIAQALGEYGAMSALIDGISSGILNVIDMASQSSPTTIFLVIGTVAGVWFFFSKR